LAQKTEAFADIRMTSDNGFIGIMSYSGISGYKTEASKGDRDYWIVKLNESGKFEWDKTLGGDRPNPIYRTSQRWRLCYRWLVTVEYVRR
jgi:hypothetical protein